jgi:Raf kinase inhibitor-like YbhB/YbcL family protein
MQAKSLVLIVDDPDAPKGTFDHWIVWNIPPQVKELEEGAKELFAHYQQVRQGLNGVKTVGYHGPCPPPGKVHHYRFRLYALNKELSNQAGASKQEIEKAMQGAILAEAALVGTYERK